jgi:secondary thiamine-phosphate synthase enzyme
MRSFALDTHQRTEFLPITQAVQEAVTASGLREGICLVFVPHTTAAVTINENADPDVTRDLAREIDKIVPWDDGYRHAEGNSAAHLKSSLFGSSVSVPVSEGRLALGTWQGIYLCEFDGPRRRSFSVQAIGSN